MSMSLMIKIIKMISLMIKLYRNDIINDKNDIEMIKSRYHQ